ncbi:MAG: hypothetical protein IJY52_01530 [Anaerotignum sp.]|nr:hypothetical protein [Anaerotignum sp.]
MSVDVKKSNYKGQNGGVIDISINATDQLAEVERMLGNLSKKAPSTLKSAVNSTAKKMKERLHEQAKTTYASRQINYKKNIKIRRATVSTLTARLHTSGERTAMSKHKVSPTRLAHGKGRPKQYRAKVLQSSPMTVMKQGDLKSFMIKFSSGHKALVQKDPEGDPHRREGTKGQYTPDGAAKRIKKYGRGADMTRIVEKKALSIAEMLGSPKVYGIVESGMGSLLQQEVEKFVAKTIEKGTAKK